MKALITGAPGRIGRSLLNYKPQNMDIELLLDPETKQLTGYPWYRSDITNYDKTVMAITCAAPDVVIHLAAITDVEKCEREPERTHKVNGDGAGNVAKSCRECGAKMVFVSTDYIFDGVSGPYSENDRPNPINVYGLSKLEGEHKALADVDNLLIIRISVPFGKRIEGSDHNFISWLIEQLQEGNTIHIADDQFTTPAYLEEFSHVLWTLVNKDISGILHYGASDRLSRYKMALDVCQIMGFPKKLVKPVKTSDLNFLAKRPLESGFVTDKVHEILNIPPISFNNAIVRMIEAPEKIV